MGMSRPVLEGNSGKKGWPAREPRGDSGCMAQAAECGQPQGKHRLWLWLEAGKSGKGGSQPRRPGWTLPVTYFGLKWPCGSDYSKDST